MLSADVIDYIFSFLRQDRATLIACSKGHPFLSDLVERHLYAHLAVYNSPDQHPESHAFHHSELYKLLSDNPHITTYVRSLEVEVFAPFELWTLVHSRADDAWIWPNLPKLPLLERITISPPPGKSIVWNNLHESFHTAFVDWLCVPTMKEASIACFLDFPLSVLDNCKSIKKVSLINGNQCFDSMTSHSSYPTLDTLSVSHAVTSSTSVISWAELHKPRSLEFKIPFGPVLKDFCQTCSSSLTNLQLDLGGAFSTKYNLSERSSTSLGTIPFSLADLPVLQQLTVCAVISFCRTHELKGDKRVQVPVCYSPLPAIRELLDTLPSSHLQRLSLQFRIEFSDPLDPSDIDIDWFPLFTISSLGIIPLIDLCISASRGSENISVEPILRVLEKDAILGRLLTEGLVKIQDEDHWN